VNERAKGPATSFNPRRAALVRLNRKRSENTQTSSAQTPEKGPQEPRRATQKSLLRPDRTEKAEKGTSAKHPTSNKIPIPRRLAVGARLARRLRSSSAALPTLKKRDRLQRGKKRPPRSSTLESAKTQNAGQLAEGCDVGAGAGTKRSKGPWSAPAKPRASMRCGSQKDVLSDTERRAFRKGIS